MSHVCSGNRSETCGGDGAVNLYQDPTFLPVGETTGDEYVALGCHKYNVNGGRAVFYRQDQLGDSTMTTKACLNSCLANRFPLRTPSTVVVSTHPTPWQHTRSNTHGPFRMLLRRGAGKRHD